MNVCFLNLLFANLLIAYRGKSLPNLLLKCYKNPTALQKFYGYLSSYSVTIQAGIEACICIRVWGDLFVCVHVILKLSAGYSENWQEQMNIFAQGKIRKFSVMFLLLCQNNSIETLAEIT